MDPNVKESSFGNKEIHYLVQELDLSVTHVYFLPKFED